nr:uncharacterized protein LOC117681905 [Crassostrea gigas]
MVFLPNCGAKRPVLLIMDNHNSHTTLDLIECPRENQVELLGLPPHTTHILQPLDVSINGPLKAKFSSTATQLGHMNKHQTVNKAKFPSVLSHTIDEICSPARVKEAFIKTGISPLNPDVIDKSQLTETHNISTVQTNSNLNQDHSPKQSTTLCSACGSFVGENPLVTEGLIPEHLSSIFAPVPAKPMAARRKLVTEARVITSNDHVQKLYEKVEEEKKKKDDVEKRKAEREVKKKAKEEEKASVWRNKIMIEMT